MIIAHHIAQNSDDVDLMKYVVEQMKLNINVKDNVTDLILLSFALSNYLHTSYTVWNASPSSRDR
jgi:hypothetical protein